MKLFTKTPISKHTLKKMSVKADSLITKVLFNFYLVSYNKGDPAKFEKRDANGREDCGTLTAE